ncbi:MAG TPA: M28 family peptidase [Candidatus Marinimicrobia bacterium]|nr:M28 family peptidase [Candidatus Neomarinimicrobiota bacterium]
MIRLLTTLLFLAFGCGPSGPDFDEDHAFEYLVAQCDFGPRNPGSEGYYACLDFIITELDQSADDIILQEFRYQEQRYRKRYDLQNIIARFNPDASFQTIISAHWDTRPWADQEDNRRDRNQPIIGANDGASGVAVLLELAKIMGETPPPIGVNLVFFDGEDLGVPGENETYCQGSRYFAKNLPIPRPDEAINLDMIGDKQLHLPVEKYSLEYNPNLVRYLWGRADDMGLDAFDITPQYAIYDDHVPLHEIAGIPAIDLIDFKYPNPYANFWHTMNDVPENCSAESLEQVGKLMVDYIYNRENQNWGE